MITTICWLRRDLRLHDHKALAHATSLNQKTIVCFIYDKNILRHLPKNDRRVNFIFESLKEIDAELRKHNSRLITISGDPIHEIPKLVAHFDAKKVYAAEDYEPYAKKRDSKVKEKLKKMDVQFELLKDHVIFSKDEILNQQNQPYKIFTAYKKAWLHKLKAEDFEEEKPHLKNLFDLKKIGKIGSFLSLNDIGFEQSKLIVQSGMSGGAGSIKKI